ncbi:MAG: NAD-dependent epimerase/dehydratase family protein [archaeon]
MKVLVTGGAGFVGSYVVRKLAENGHDVAVFDSLAKEGTVASDVKFIRGDITNASDVNAAFKGREGIIHLAAQTQVQESIKNPVKDATINILGTLNCLNAAVNSTVEKFVSFSSAAAYGEPKELPLKEETPCEPISPYGASKLATETYCNAFSKIHNLDTIVLRPFNIYGKGGGGVIPLFLGRIQNEESFTMYGDGTQTRDYIYVEDIVNGCILALEKGKRGVYNIGTGIETSLNELIETMGKVTGKKPDVKLGEHLEGDIQRSVADIIKIKKDLGFEPKYSLEDGLREMVK